MGDCAACFRVHIAPDSKAQPTRSDDTNGFGPNNTTPPVFDRHTQAGGGDVSAGFRVGIIDWEDEWLTGQFTVTTPTGKSHQALGVGHSSIDAALLYQRQWSERLTFMAELHDWQTIHLLLA
jgi:hypothetical protein